MALSATATQIQLHGSANITRPVGASDTVYVRAFGALIAGTSGTAGDRGDVVGFSAAEHQIPWGWASNSNQADAVGAVAFRYVNLQESEGLVTIGQGIVASGATDVGRLVWASDDGTYSFTRGTRNALIGMCEEFRAADEVRVLALSPEGQLCAALAFQGTQIVPFALDGTISGATTFSLTIPAHCELVKVQAIVMAQMSSGSIAGTWSCSTGAITGGTFTWANQPEGTELTVVAVTLNDNNIIHEDDVLNLIATPASSNGGLLMVYATLRARAGF